MVPAGVRGKMAVEMLLGLGLTPFTLPHPRSDGERNEAEGL